MKTWNEVASDEVIATTVTALQNQGVDVYVVETAAQAKEKFLSLIPLGAQVMTMTSMTLDAIGASKEINESGRYDSVRAKFATMDRVKDHLEMQRLGAAPEWAVGSVHAVTQDGKIVVVSNTGSQLSAYAYGASHVVWVVGAQKLVPNLDEAMKRIYEYVLPLEAERARQAYKTAGSNVSKILIVQKEVKPHRLTLIVVKERLGY